MSKFEAPPAPARCTLPLHGVTIDKPGSRTGAAPSVGLGSGNREVFQPEHMR
jgi:hypothetical protein